MVCWMDAKQNYPSSRSADSKSLFWGIQRVAQGER